jgi:hypothetical protein
MAADRVSPYCPVCLMLHAGCLEGYHQSHHESQRVLVGTAVAACPQQRCYCLSTHRWSPSESGRGHPLSPHDHLGCQEQQTRTDQVIAELQRRRLKLEACRPATGPDPTNGAPSPSTHHTGLSHTLLSLTVAMNIPQGAAADQNFIAR